MTGSSSEWSELLTRYTFLLAALKETQSAVIARSEIVNGNETLSVQDVFSFISQHC